MCFVMATILSNFKHIFQIPKLMWPTCICFLSMGAEHVCFLSLIGVVLSREIDGFQWTDSPYFLQVGPLPRHRH
jgi:hypothetical protein